MTISRVNDVDVDFGDVPQIPPFYAEGGRPPHEVTLAKPDGTVSIMYSDSITGNCIGTFTKTCTITMGDEATTHKMEDISLLLKTELNKIY